MPSVTYMNQSAPFWDFIANLEQQGQNHPFFSQNHDNTETQRGAEEHSSRSAPEHPFGPWGWGFPGFGGRGFPHHGPPTQEEPADSKANHDSNSNEKDNEKQPEGNEQEKAKQPENKDNGEGPSNSGSENEGCARGRGRHGRCNPGRRGRHGFGGPHPGGRGGWGPWGHGGAFNPLAFTANLFDPTFESASATKPKSDPEDFSPEADIFDTPSSFVVHVSLPGAKKEDVGVNWDAEKSELSIAGVVYRPGDEEFLKTLAMTERKAGPFERKVRLGTRANPTQVDADMITAKLEDGVLRVDVPKMDAGFVEVRKVDIE
ncbi:HSP20-like chaperone [Massariosphaeria phaeospora]|uniref:HSP20-like chaperone n=1 Tax=Massariosphaeria phaeospora TaxID=100035 RepID=A0A7C8MSX7_9PLEO|nr:HSP20-like chaperone [Massariosphaeria phaeospora]